MRVQKSLALGVNEYGEPLTIPVTVITPEIAPGQAMPEGLTLSLEVQSARETMLMEAARSVEISKVQGKTEQVEKSKRLFTILYYYTTRIDISIIGKRKKRINLNINYHYYENGPGQEETERAVLDALGEMPATAIIRYIAGLIPAPVKKPQRKRPKPTDGRLPVALMKANTQDRGPDLFSLLPESVVNNHKRALQNKALKAESGVWDAGVKFVNSKGKPLPYKARHRQLIDALTATIAAKSTEVRNKEAKEYYRGNTPTGDDTIGIITTITELARQFSGMDRPGAPEINAVKETIEEMQRPELWPAIYFEGTRQTKKGGKQGTETMKVDLFEPLITLGDVTRTFTPKDNKQDTITEQVLLAKINPVFSKYIAEAKMYAVIPGDIVKRMHMAWGKPGAKPVGLWILRDILLMALAHGRTTHTESARKLLPKMFPELVAGGRKDRIQKQFDDITQALTRMGMMTSVEEVDPDGLGKQYVFQLNNRWYKDSLPEGDYTPQTGGD